MWWVIVGLCATAVAVQAEDLAEVHTVLEVRANHTVVDKFRFRPPFPGTYDDFYDMYHPLLWPHVIRAHLNMTMDPATEVALLKWSWHKLRDPKSESAIVEFGANYTLVYYRNWAPNAEKFIVEFCSAVWSLFLWTIQLLFYPAAALSLVLAWLIVFGVPEPIQRFLPQSDRHERKKD